MKWYFTHRAEMERKFSAEMIERARERVDEWMREEGDDIRIWERLSDMDEFQPLILDVYLPGGRRGRMRQKFFAFRPTSVGTKRFSLDLVGLYDAKDMR